MTRLLKFTSCFSLGIVFFISCQKELSCPNCKGNQLPVANAGADQTIILPKDSVLLDGTASTDPDGTIVSYKWIKIGGPASFNILAKDSPKTLVKTLVMGVYEFELTVTDNGGLSAKDTVQIIVNDVTVNYPPIACAGADQVITLPTDSVNLNSNCSTDPENNITGYSWTKISGPSSVNIVNPNAVQTQVLNLVQGTYQFELKVTDAGGLFSKDTMRVTVSITQPDPCIGSPGRPLINAQLIPFATLSYARTGMSVASTGNKILFAGGYDPGGGGNSGHLGFSRVDIYDTFTHNWSIAELSKARYGMGVSVSGNKIFFAGGINTDNVAGGFQENYPNVDVYDASIGSWSVDALSLPRYITAAAVVGNKVFFAGGSKYGAINRSSVVDIYNLTTNSWSGASLSEARSAISAVTANNKIYFAGGYTNNFNSYPSTSGRIDIYDNATSTWSTSSLIQPRGEMACIAFAGKIYWAGGLTNNGFSSQVEIKDVNTQTSVVACLFQPNAVFDAVIKDNKIVFFTGDDGALKNKFDIYDPATNTWSIGVLPVDINGASIISVNNTIYVAGGYVNGVISNQVWKLDL